MGSSIDTKPELLLLSKDQLIRRQTELRAQLGQAEAEGKFDHAEQIQRESLDVLRVLNLCYPDWNRP